MINLTNETKIERALEDSSEIIFSPRGISMWPILKAKNLSVVVKKKTSRLNLYDVVLYKRGEVLILHRIVKLMEDGYLVCGDSQFGLEKLSEDSIIGVLVGFYYGEKYTSVQDESYIRRVQKWYKRKKLRKFRIKCFNFRNRAKSKLKRIFKRDK